MGQSSRKDASEGEAASAEPELKSARAAVATRIPVLLCLVAAGAGLATAGWTARETLASLTWQSLWVLGLAFAGATMLGGAIAWLVGRLRVERGGRELAFAAGALGRGEPIGPSPTGFRSRELDPAWSAVQEARNTLQSLAAELVAATNAASEGAASLSGRATALATTESDGRVSSLADDADAIAGSSRELSVAAAELTRVAETSGRAVAERDDRLAHVLSSVDGCQAQVEQGVAALADLSASGADGVGELAALDRLSDEMRSFVLHVRKMAKQFKLLALNASMEAARVGDQGRGFAAVASEMRRLAAASSDAAERAEQVVSEAARRLTLTRELTDTAGDAAARAMAATGAGLASLREVGAELRGADRASQPDPSGTSEPSIALAARLEESSQRATQVAVSIRTLQTSDADRAAKARDVAAAAQALGDAVRRVQSLVGPLARGLESGSPVRRRGVRLDATALSRLLGRIRQSRVTQPVTPARVSTST